MKETLISIIHGHVCEDAARIAVIDESQGAENSVEITREELWRHSMFVAQQLSKVGMRGDRVMLLFPPGGSYLAGFLGCLIAGRIAVPAYPPDPMRLDRTLPRLRLVVEDAGASVALIDDRIEGFIDIIGDMDESWRKLNWISVPTRCPIDFDPSGEVDISIVDAKDVAFLQYTSGSTGNPKGVRVLHGNLLANVNACAARTEVDDSTVAVSWLPPYHDMGLIGMTLTPFRCGIPTVILSPLAFLSKPMSWLDAISRHGGTHTASPDFGYSLCAYKATEDDIAGFDLSSMKVAINGAEPIRFDNLMRFSERFSQCGFKSSAFMPAYGLAEATLIVSSVNASDEPAYRSFDRRALMNGEMQIVGATNNVDADSTARLVSCGTVIDDHQVRIISDGRDVTSSQEVGEIWVKGPSITDGYWNNEIASTSVFNAMVNGEGGWLRTGDLGGFVDGELFVTGRDRDLLIVRGRNFSPQDLEKSVEAVHGSVRKGCVVAFQTDSDGGDEPPIVIVAEVNPTLNVDAADLVDDIRHAVALDHGLFVESVVLIVARSIPKTTSGKLQRSETRQRFLDDSLDVVYMHTMKRPAWRPPVTENEKWLAQMWSQVLGAPDVGLDDDFLALGGNSLLAAQIVDQIRKRGFDIDMEMLVGASVLRDLALLLDELEESAKLGEIGKSGHSLLSRAREELSSDATVEAVVPLRRRLKLGNHSVANPVVSVLRIAVDFEPDIVRRALLSMVSDDALLRMTYNTRDDSLVVHKAGLQLPFVFVDHAGELPDVASEKIAQLIDSIVFDRLDIHEYPTWQVLHAREDYDVQILAAIAHPCLADELSVDQLLADIVERCISDDDSTTRVGLSVDQMDDWINDVARRSPVVGALEGIDSVPTALSEKLVIDMSALDVHGDKRFAMDRLVSVAKAAVAELLPDVNLLVAGGDGLTGDDNQALFRPVDGSMYGFARDQDLTTKTFLIHPRMIDFIADGPFPPEIDWLPSMYFPAAATHLTICICGATASVHLQRHMMPKGDHGHADLAGLLATAIQTGIS